ncbi:MAG: hypothetical protein KGI67_01025, partial [Pseudomonadota bacterium]|nr:hypothetical protein [Pseudomonadota bacterium]
HEGLAANEMHGAERNARCQSRYFKGIESAFHFGVKGFRNRQYPGLQLFAILKTAGLDDAGKVYLVSTEIVSSNRESLAIVLCSLLKTNIYYFLLRILPTVFQVAKMKHQPALM